jgi:hypothetical protein
MAATILEEGANSKVDVFFSQDAGALGAVSSQTETVALPQDVLDLVPTKYRAVDGSWVGISGRARVLAYNPELVSDLPASVFDLADPGWKGRIAIAPTNASFHGLPVIRGQYGVKNGRYSVKIQTIQHPEEFLKSPLESARLGPSMMRGVEQGELYEQFSDSVANISDGADAQSLSPANLARSPVSDTINSLADTLVAKD